MMTKVLTLASSALVFGLLVLPAAYAMDTAQGTTMSGDAMMHKDGSKDKKKHKDSMMGGNAMKGDAMKGDAMKNDEALPQR